MLVLKIACLIFVIISHTFAFCPFVIIKMFESATHIRNTHAGFARVLVGLHRVIRSSFDLIYMLRSSHSKSLALIRFHHLRSKAINIGLCFY